MTLTHTFNNNHLFLVLNIHGKSGCFTFWNKIAVPIETPAPWAFVTRPNNSALSITIVRTSSAITFLLKSFRCDLTDLHLLVRPINIKQCDLQVGRAFFFKGHKFGLVSTVIRVTWCSLRIVGNMLSRALLNVSRLPLLTSLPVHTEIEFKLLCLTYNERCFHYIWLTYWLRTMIRNLIFC